MQFTNHRVLTSKPYQKKIGTLKSLVEVLLAATWAKDFWGCVVYFTLLISQKNDAEKREYQDFMKNG